MILLWIETALLFMQIILGAKEFTIFKITSNWWQSREDRASDRDRLESAGASAKEKLVQSRQPRNLKSWVRTSRGIEKHARQFILEDTDRQDFGNRAFAAVVELRPTASTDEKWTSMSQRTWKLISAEALTNKDLKFVHISTYFTKIFYDTELNMKLMEQYDGHEFWHSSKMLKIGTKKNELTYSIVLPTNPEWNIRA